MSLVESIPTFTGSTTLRRYRASFDVVRCVHFKRATDAGDPEKNTAIHDGTGPAPAAGTKRRHDDGAKTPIPRPPTKKALAFQKLILSAVESSTPSDRDSWTVERSSPTTATTTTATTKERPSDFLSPASTLNGYRSFVLQDDATSSVSAFTSHPLVAHPTLPLHSSSSNPTTDVSSSVRPAGPYWLFLGRNTSPTPMEGRNEHTDDVPHDGGTFHCQAVGTKVWTIRPTEGLRAACDGLDTALMDRYEVAVGEGDVFVIDTRYWWHRMEIPGVGVGEGGVSISYARDLWLDGAPWGRERRWRSGGRG